MPVLRALSRHTAGDSSISVLLRPAIMKASDPRKATDVAELRKLGVNLVSDTAWKAMLRAVDLPAGRESNHKWVGTVWRPFVGIGARPNGI